VQKNKISNEVVVAHDASRLSTIFWETKSHRGNNLKPLPQVVLLDLKFAPDWTVWRSYAGLRAQERTKLCRVVILNVVEEEQDASADMALVQNSYVANRWDFNQFY